MPAMEAWELPGSVSVACEVIEVEAVGAEVVGAEVIGAGEDDGAEDVNAEVRNVDDGLVSLVAGSVLVADDV